MAGKPLEPNDEIKIKASTLVTLMKLIGWKSFVIGKDSDISDDEFINQRNEDIQKLIRAAILNTVADSCFDGNSCMSEDVSQKVVSIADYLKHIRPRKDFL